MYLRRRFALGHECRDFPVYVLVPLAKAEKSSFQLSLSATGSGNRRKTMSNKSEKQTPGFMIYDEISKALLSLPNDELGEVIRAAIRYKLFAESKPTLSSGLEFAYCLLQGKIDIDTQKYVEKCRKNAENRRGKETDVDDR